MDVASFIVGLVVGILIALAWLTFSHRVKPKASRSETRRLKRGDTGDVLADADRRMAQGYFDDAASLVATAIASEPGRKDLKLKLLEVYFIWGKPSEFVGVARQYHRSLRGTPEWAKVETMGEQLCSEDPLFRGSQRGAA